MIKSGCDGARRNKINKGNNFRISLSAVRVCVCVALNSGHAVDLLDNYPIDQECSHPVLDTRRDEQQDPTTPRVRRLWLSKGPAPHQIQAGQIRR